MGRVKIILSVLLLVGLLLISVSAQSGEGENEIIPVVVQLDSPKGQEWTRKDLFFLATHYRGISDRSVNFSREQLQYMRQINPGLFLVKYLSISTVHGKRADKVLARIPAAALYNSDADPEPPLWNRRKRGIIFNPAHPQWKRYVVRQAQKIREMGYDGLLLDECLMANRLPGKFGGIDPSTGRIYSTRAFRNAIFSCMENLRRQMGSTFLLIANSVANGEKYWQEGSEQFLSLVDGVSAEGFRGSGNWPNTRLFKRDTIISNVEMLMDVDRAGKYCIAVVKYSKTSMSFAGSSMKRGLDLFHLSCFLLGKGERSLFASTIFDKNHPALSDNTFNELWQLQTGKAIGAYYESDGILQREFTRVKVFVNPSSDMFEFAVTGNFTTLSGAPLERLLIRPFSGVILLKQVVVN